MSDARDGAIHEPDGWAESGPREACAHPGIHGSYHRYEVLEWWPADEEPGPFGQETPHPICPVDECASGDDGHECRIICERIPTKNGSGAWECNLHGYFRVFGYPREEEPETETEQAKLVTDGGAREQPDGEIEQHTMRGVGGETRVYCPEADHWYGPSPKASFNIEFCPYCSADARWGEHTVSVEIGEVFCPETGQSTYRYCPNCREEVTTGAE